MIYRSSTSDVNWTMLGLVVLLFILSTMHVGAGLRRLVDGFIFSASPHQYFEGGLYPLTAYRTRPNHAHPVDQAHWTNAFFDCLYVTINMVGEAIVVSAFSPFGSSCY